MADRLGGHMPILIGVGITSAIVTVVLVVVGARMLGAMADTAKDVLD